MSFFPQSGPMGVVWAGIPAASATTRKKFWFGEGGPIELAPLPTDSIGIFALTLEGLVVGSAVRIEAASTGALVEFRVAASSTEVFAVPAYPSGNDNNSLRIKVRKATSAPFYKPYLTQATASVSSQSIFIEQIED